MEIFKDVKQFEDTYEVSNYGRVRNKKNWTYESACFKS